MPESPVDSSAPRGRPPTAAQPWGSDSVAVREYGTRYLRIMVRYHRTAGFGWLRTPGPGHTHQQCLPRPEVEAALRRVDTATGIAAEDRPGARLALGEWATVLLTDVEAQPSIQFGVLYRRVPGAVSLARLLPSGNDIAFRHSVDAMADVGKTLRRLHQVPWQFSEQPPHRGVRRLLAWISEEDVAPAAARLHELARNRLGPSLWTRLRDWSVAATETPSGGGAVLLHGAPSIGWLVPSLAGSHTALLTGEEVTGGDPALDLGWLLGELHELRAAASYGLGSAGKGPPVDYSTAARALLAGYTGGDGPPRLPVGTARAATLRLAVHMRDFASFVGWHEDLRHYCDLLAETLTEDGAPTVEWAERPGSGEDRPRR